MKIFKYFIFLLLAATISCEGVTPENGNGTEGTGVTVPCDDLLESGEVDMTGWPDYTKAEMSASGPSVVVYSQNKSTVNGKPFLPLGIYGVNQADMAAIAEYGFNLIQSYQVVPTDLENTEDWLDAAQANGLMCFLNLDGARLDEAKIAQIQDVVKQFKNHPALYAWYLADEPKVAEVTPAELTSVYDWIKNEDRNHPVFTSNWELNNFADACDADMRQLYAGVPSCQTPDLTEYFNTYGSNIKTWVAIVNSHDINWEQDGDELNPANMYTDSEGNTLVEGTPEWEAAEAQAQFVVDHKDDPEAAGLKFSSGFPKTPLLLRSSLYWPMAHGSNGFYYWLYQDPDVLNIRWGWYTTFHKSDLNAAIPGILDEFAQLSKFLVNPGISSISISQESLHIWSKVVDNRRIIIIINESASAFEDDIDLAELYIPDRTLEVYNDDREDILLTGNVLTDTFEPNEVRVYFVK